MGDTLQALAASKPHWVEPLIPKPEDGEQRRFIARQGLSRYLLLLGIRRQMHEQLRRQVSDQQELAIVTAVYRSWGWSKSPHQPLSELIDTGAFSAASNEHCCQHLAQRQLITIHGSGPDREVSCAWRDPDLSAAEAEIYAAGTASIAQGLELYPPAELCIYWGQLWAAKQQALLRATDSYQRALIERLFQQGFDYRQPLSNAEQLTFTVDNNNSDHRPQQLSAMRSQLALLAHDELIVLQDGAWPNNSNRQARYALVLPNAAQPPAGARVERGLAAIFNANRPPDSEKPQSTPGLADLLAAGLTIADYLVLQGRLTQAWRSAHSQVSDQLGQQLLAEIFSAARQGQDWLSGAENSAELDAYSAQEIAAALEDLEQKNLLFSRPAALGGPSRYNLLPPSAYRPISLTGRQPERQQIADFIAARGPEEYYFQLGRAIQAESGELSAGPVNVLRPLSRRILRPLARRALLDDRQRFLSAGEITAQLPAGNNDQSTVEGYLHLLADQGVIERRRRRYALRLL